MDSDSTALRPDRSAPAPAVRVHADRVAPSQPLELTPSMAFAMIARDADAAAGVSVRTPPRATASGLRADAPAPPPLTETAVAPAPPPDPVSSAVDELAVEHHEDVERIEPADEDVAAVAPATPPRRVRWWHRLLRRRSSAACSMCRSTILPCPLGHP